MRQFYRISVRRDSIFRMTLFRNAIYHASAHHLRDLPPAVGIEIAFAGRSNAGKSSAINTLADHNRLAYVSKQPGRTQLINFFSLGDEKYLVDLPGYGYAKVPESLRNHWQQVLSAYLSERFSLHGLVLVMDARHPLQPLDWQMLHWFLPTGKPVHILLTKSDKLSKSESIKTLRTVQGELAEFASTCTVQLFSSLKKQGVEQADKVIGAWLNPLKDDVPDVVAKG
jgi:GTP-binding protein